MLQQSTVVDYLKGKIRQRVKTDINISFEAQLKAPIVIIVLQYDICFFGHLRKIVGCH